MTGEHRRIDGDAISSIALLKCAGADAPAKPADHATEGKGDRP